MFEEERQTFFVYVVLRRIDDTSVHGMIPKPQPPMTL